MKKNKTPKSPELDKYLKDREEYAQKMIETMILVGLYPPGTTWKKIKNDRV